MDDADRPQLGLDRSAALVGGYRWFEHQLFELTGGWAASAEAPAVQVHLDEVSLQHAWHADLWGDRIPVLDRIDPDDVVRPLAPGCGDLVSAMAELDGPALDVRRLAALYRVAVPRLIVSYEQHLQRAVPVADRPVIRALRLTLRDEVESWQSGEALLQALLAGPDEVGAAADTQGRLESLVAGAGAGLVVWPPRAPGPGTSPS